MIDKYLYLYDFEKPKTERHINTISKKPVVAPIKLDDDRINITSPQEMALMHTAILIHQVSDYRKKVNNTMLPNVSIITDELLWDRRELYVLPLVSLDEG